MKRITGVEVLLDGEPVGDILSDWQHLCRELEIDPAQQKVIQRAFDKAHKRLE